MQGTKEHRLKPLTQCHYRNNFNVAFNLQDQLQVIILRLTFCFTYVRTFELTLQRRLSNFLLIIFVMATRMKRNFHFRKFLTFLLFYEFCK